jgi:hypothetical protein
VNAPLTPASLLLVVLIVFVVGVAGKQVYDHEAKAQREAHCRLAIMNGERCER